MRRTLVIAVLTLLPLPVALADIYRSVDAQGHVQYSDTPSPGAELVYSSTAESHPTVATSGASESGRIPSLAQRGEQISEQLAQREAARAVERDRTAVRSKQCKQAQQAYQQSIEARRLYKVGADGERQYLTDDEADQQRVNNRLAMESACDGASDASGAADDGASRASGSPTSATGASSPTGPTSTP